MNRGDYSAQSRPRLKDGKVLDSLAAEILATAKLQFFQCFSVRFRFHPPSTIHHPPFSY